MFVNSLIQDMRPLISLLNDVSRRCFNLKTSMIKKQYK